MKKLIALGLAGIMTLGCGLSALAVEPNGKDANIGAATSGNTETQFWLKVDDEENAEEPVVDVTEIEPGANGKFYKVDYKDSSKSNFKVTVPLYVAMYAYGKSGKVVSPAEDAYKITNESTKQDKKWVAKVTEYEQLSETAIALLGEISNNAGQPITTDEELMTTGVNFEIKSGDTVIQSKAEIKEVIAASDFFYIDAAGKLAGFAATDSAVLTLDGQEGHFRATGNVAEANDAVLGGYTVQDAEHATAGEEENVDVRVTELEAAANGWDLVSTVPSRAKELYMTVNGVDLANAVESPYQTTGSNWIIKNGTDAALQLPITAAIAANMNEYETTQVVSVSYTVDVA